MQSTDIHLMHQKGGPRVGTWSTQSSWLSVVHASEELDKMEEEEIKKKLQPQGIITVKIISIRYSLYVLTIKGQNIP